MPGHDKDPRPHHTHRAHTEDEHRHNHDERSESIIDSKRRLLAESNDDNAQPNHHHTAGHSKQQPPPYQADAAQDEEWFKLQTVSTVIWDPRTDFETGHCYNGALSSEGWDKDLLRSTHLFGVKRISTRELSIAYNTEDPNWDGTKRVCNDYKMLRDENGRLQKCDMGGFIEEILQPGWSYDRATIMYDIETGNGKGPVPGKGHSFAPRKFVLRRDGPLNYKLEEQAGKKREYAWRLQRNSAEQTRFDLVRPMGRGEDHDHILGNMSFRSGLPAEGKPASYTLELVEHFGKYREDENRMLRTVNLMASVWIHLHYFGVFGPFAGPSRPAEASKRYRDYAREAGTPPEQKRSLFPRVWNPFSSDKGESERKFY